MNTPKALLGASVLLLTLSAVFGVLNTNKTRALREEVMRSESSRQQSERRHEQREKALKAQHAGVPPNSLKAGADPAAVAAAETEMIKSQTEKQELQNKLRANEAEIAELKKRIAESGPLPLGAAPTAQPTAELETQLADARKQLDTAEREKSLLSDKIRSAQERSTQLETEKKRRVATTGNPGVRGTVLAVNQAYNFVVLNLGARHGLEANSEMLVMRGGTLIGKIRVSSVEPATAIGDIITNSLARGVQVQPGDTVIYAGSNF